MKVLINSIGIASALFGAGTILWCGVSTIAQVAHDYHCTGPDTGKCGWAWCKYYDGSDSLHDFN